MKEGKKVLLHVVADTLFIDSLIDRFNSFEGYKNIFMYRKVGSSPSSCTKIRKTDSVIFPKSPKERNELLSNEENDVIIFHGLFSDSFTFRKYLPLQSLVIWLSYGQDLYQGNRFNSPLIKVKLYKKRTGLTLPCLKRRFLTLLSYVNGSLRGGDKERKKFLSRVDYVSTPFPVEYEYLSELPYFKAKPFMLRGVRGYSYAEPVVRDRVGSLMIGHSAVFTDNHVDIVHALRGIDLSDRQIIMPISYGQKEWMDYLKKKYNNICGSNVIFLEGVLPKNEYFTVMKNCSHAIFGPLRQQAAGNINACMKMGIKVFLYKDSMDYIQYKKDGYIVYSIEDDLTQEELSTPLTREQSVHNHDVFYSVLGYDNADDVRKSMKNQFDELFK